MHTIQSSIQSDRHLLLPAAIGDEMGRIHTVIFPDDGHIVARNK